MDRRGYIWDRTLALNLTGEALEGQVITGILRPNGPEAVTEPTLAWDWGYRSALDPLPHTKSSALDALLELVTDPDIAGDEDARCEHVLWIAERFGPLELCEHRLPLSHHPNCGPTCREAVSDWVVWATVFLAAREGEPISESALERLGLTPSMSDARRTIRWLAMGYGWLAIHPRHTPFNGLFARLAEELGEWVAAAEPEDGLCRLCQAPIAKKSLGKGATHCDPCREKKKEADKQRRRRHRKKKAGEILELALEGRDESDRLNTLRRIVENPSVLGASSSSDPLLNAARALAKKDLEKLENPLRKGQKR